MLGTAPTTEIVKVLRLGLVVLCEGTTHNHPQGTPMTLLVDPNLDVAPTASEGSSQDIALGLSPLPGGLDYHKGNKERRFSLPDGGLPKSRKTRHEWHMMLLIEVCNSNMGCNEVREREFLNFVDAMDMDAQEVRQSSRPQAGA